MNRDEMNRLNRDEMNGVGLKDLGCNQVWAELGCASGQAGMRALMHAGSQDCLQRWLRCWWTSM